MTYLHDMIKQGQQLRRDQYCTRVYDQVARDLIQRVFDQTVQQIYPYHLDWRGYKVHSVGCIPFYLHNGLIYICLHHRQHFWHDVHLFCQYWRQKPLELFGQLRDQLGLADPSYHYSYYNHTYHHLYYLCPTAPKTTVTTGKWVSFRDLQNLSLHPRLRLSDLTTNLILKIARDKWKHGHPTSSLRLKDHHHF